MTQEYDNFYLDNSSIHGTGTFAKKKIDIGTVIDVGIDFDPITGLIPYVTPHFGSYINHSWNPNAHLEWINNKWYLVSSNTIPRSAEITMDYRITPWYILGPDPSWNQ